MNKFEKRAIIVSGFPGIGKSYATNAINTDGLFKAIDSDFSYFSWLYDKEGNKISEFTMMGEVKYTRDPNFPQNYVNYIKANIKKNHIIFVSSHLSVRELMKKEGIDFYVAVPEATKEMRDIMMKRFRERGNDEKFIEDQFNNYFNRISEMMESVPKEQLIIIKPDEYLIDHIGLKMVIF